MQLIRRVRRGGKTTEAIKLAAEKSATIVCASATIAKTYSARAREMGLDIPPPIGVDEFLDRRATRGRSIPGFIIDDADLLLQRLAQHVPVIAATVTGADPD